MCRIPLLGCSCCSWAAPYSEIGSSSGETRGRTVNEARLGAWMRGTVCRPDPRPDTVPAAVRSRISRSRHALRRASSSQTGEGHDSTDCNNSSRTAMKTARIEANIPRIHDAVHRTTTAAPTLPSNRRAPCDAWRALSGIECGFRRTLGSDAGGPSHIERINRITLPRIFPARRQAERASRRAGLLHCKARLGYARARRRCGAGPLSGARRALSAGMIFHFVKCNAT